MKTKEEPKQENDMKQISEEIKAKIEEKFSWNKAPSHYSNNESSCWSNGAIDGAEYGYGLAQEEIDRLRNSGVKHILEQANENRGFEGHHRIPGEGDQPTERGVGKLQSTNF